MVAGVAERSERGTVARRRPDHWAERYRTALADYLAGAGEGGLRTACQIGHAALADGAGLPDMVVVHHAAMETVPAGVAENRTDMLHAAGTFLAESLAAFEKRFLNEHEAKHPIRPVYDVFEHESRRIAHFIHDEVGQILFALHIAVEDLNRVIDPSSHPEIGLVTKLTLKMEEQIHRLSHELRPMILEDLGLVPALEFLARGISQRSGTRVTVLSGFTERLSPAVETVVYRVVQEALANMAKHSGATRCEVILVLKDQMLRCTVRDNGVGFCVDPSECTGRRGLGLVGIRERIDSVGGDVQIRSQSGRGTRLHIDIPVGGCCDDSRAFGR